MAKRHHTTEPEPPRKMSGILRLAWLIVLAMMLTAAAWSISAQLIRWDMPNWLAYGISIMFDAAGLLAAEYARRAVERGTGAALPRLSILVFVTIAGILNYDHGHDIGGMPAAIAFASVSALVELLFELHRRDARDEQRSRRGLVGEMLPRIPAIAWIMFPKRSWKTLRAAVRLRLDTADPVRTDTTDNHRTTPSAEDLADVTDYLESRGRTQSADAVRALSGQQDTSSPSLRSVPAGLGRTIADTVRRQLSDGVQEFDRILEAVRHDHGRDVSTDTVRRTVSRLGGAA